MDLYDEMGISSEVRAANEELRRLKIASMGYTHVGHDGSVVVDSCPALSELQAQISAIESKLQAVSDLRDQVIALLNGQGVATIKDLRETKAQHANVIQSNPIRAWDLFRMTKELAIERGNATVRTAMPSELPELLDGYQDAEDALKAELVVSQAAITNIAVALDSIGELMEQAKETLNS